MSTTFLLSPHGDLVVKPFTQRSMVIKNRFRIVGNSVMFKSKLRMETVLADQHYNQWYKIAPIPAGLKGTPFLTEIVARAFLANGNRPLTEDEVRAAVLAHALK